MVLITGHKGVIGSILAENISHVGIDLKEGRNLLTCEMPPNVDVIYHLAAQSDVVPSWEDPLHDLDNIRMTARLVKAYPNAKIIYANSAAALEPIMSPYGFSKWASGEYLKRFHKNYVICTFPNVYGTGRSVVDIFKDSQNVDVYGDGLQTRDYVYMGDIVRGLLLAKDWPVGEYQMGSGIQTTVLDLAKGKNITYKPERKEARETIMRNDTPNWIPQINVYEYLNS